MPAPSATRHRPERSRSFGRPRPAPTADPTPTVRRRRSQADVRGERYVALGLAHARSNWFSDLARWSTTAAIPVEFVKCVTVEEVRARLASERAFSALLVDGGLPGLDRELVDEALSCRYAVIVVHDGRLRRDSRALGASAVLP